VQISALRSALADAARAVVLPSKAGKLTCTGEVPDSITEPHFFVADLEIDYDKTMARGKDEVRFTCRVLVGRQDDKRAQAILDAMLSGAGPASLKAVMEQARGAPGEMALGGLADDFRVERVQAYRWYEHVDTKYVGAELVVRVIGPGGT
jgi:hypothetical protein